MTTFFALFLDALSGWLCHGWVNCTSRVDTGSLQHFPHISQTRVKNSPIGKQKQEGSIHIFPYQVANFNVAENSWLFEKT